mgnify:CR=1 FL=1
MTKHASHCPDAAELLHVTWHELGKRGPLWPATWVAIGNFDGLHVGHRRILATAVSQAAGTAAPVALTFHPHPRAVIGCGAPPALMTLRARSAGIRALGVQSTVCLHFDADLARVPADEFVKHVLVGGLGARGVVVGDNFRFGHRAQGTPDLLRVLGQQYGFAVAVVEPVRCGGDVVSSSLIRRRLLEGDVEAANGLLGRPFRLPGRVVRGDGRGRTIGFPTANVQPEPEMLLPGEGVYRVRLWRGQEGLPAVAAISRRPTFVEGPVALEVHVLDFAGDLYGEAVEVEFLDRLRGIVPFGSAEELRRQIQQDVAMARARFAAGAASSPSAATVCGADRA